MISLNTYLLQASGTSRLPKAAPGAARGAADQAAPRPSRIVARGLAKRFGDLRIFEDVNFEVGEREVVAIVGPSGCGKTTLLRCIAGLTPYESGMISIEDQAVTGPALGLAVVFQHFGLFPWKTVYANVAFSLRMAGAPREEVSSKVPRFLEMLGLKGFENAYPYQISSGMQQRCGLARALAIETSAAASSRVASDARHASGATPASPMGRSAQGPCPIIGLKNFPSFCNAQ
jgi:NitT/TauT family transport system ATP-binding protein